MSPSAYEYLRHIRDETCYLLSVGCVSSQNSKTTSDNHSMFR